MEHIIRLKEDKDLKELLSNLDLKKCIHFVLNDSDVNISVGKSSLGLYQMKVSKKYPYWQYRVMDFIGYVQNTDLVGLIEISDEDYQKAQCVYSNSTYDGVLRDYEKKILVHSTNASAWENIKNDYKLKSWNLLEREGFSLRKNPIGVLLGDPDEFKNYVMLGEGISSEVVVSSFEKNEINTDTDSFYEPGARIYLDAKMIAKDGLLIRDGVHIKVKNSLDLSKYMMMVLTPNNFADKRWTPTKFATSCDNVFRKKFNIEN